MAFAVLIACVGLGGGLWCVGGLQDDPISIEPQRKPRGIRLDDVQPVAGWSG